MRDSSVLFKLFTASALVLFALLVGTGCGDGSVTEGETETGGMLAGIDTSQALISAEDVLKSESELLIPFQSQGKWGFADSSGKLIIEARYDAIEPFNEGLAVVKLGDFYGMVNMQGEEVIRPEHARITPCASGVFTIETPEGVIIMNQDAKVISQGQYDEIFAYTSSEGRIPVRKDGKIGFLDTEGNPITEVVYDKIFRFSSGHAPVLRLNEEGPEGWGVINRKGELVVEHSFRKLYPFKGGLSVGSLVNEEREEKWGVIDTLGNPVVPFMFDYVAGTASGTHIVGRMNGPDPMGADDVYTVYNRQGEKLWVTEVTLWDEFSEGLAVMENKGKFGFVDTTGVVLIPPYFDWACGFSEGMAWVKKGNVFGFIDHEGNTVIPFKYTSEADYVAMKKSGVLVTDAQTGEEFYLDPSGREYR